MSLQWCPVSCLYLDLRKVSRWRRRRVEGNVLPLSFVREAQSFYVIFRPLTRITLTPYVSPPVLLRAVFDLGDCGFGLRRQGCGSDVPGHWYSLSRAPNPYWASYYPAQGELQAYWAALWARAGLSAHTRCGTEVVRATWDPTARTYAVELEDAASRARRTVVARVVINAAGGFQAPRVPDDLRTAAQVFEGESWHSALWRHDVPLGGKRVGVIGNGCSAYVFFIFWGGLGNFHR